MTRALNMIANFRRQDVETPEVEAFRLRLIKLDTNRIAVRPKIDLFKSQPSRQAV